MVASITLLAEETAVTADPSEPWAPLLDGAVLVAAQMNQISGDWVLTWEGELKSSAVSIVKINNGRIE